MPEKPSGRLLSCDHCNYTSNRSYDLRRHQQRHTRPKTIDGVSHKCIKCEFTTKWKRNMKRHMQKHNNDKCSEDEQVIEEYIVEMLVSSESEPDNYVVETETYRIIDSATGQTNNESQIERGPLILKCDVCSYTTKRSYDLRRHKQRHLKVSRYDSSSHKCPKCQFITKWKRNMKRHMRIHEKETGKDEQQEDEQQKFEQSTTDYTVELEDSDEVYVYSFSKSVDSQSLEKTYTCWLCDYETNRSFDLRRHSLRHAREKPLTGLAYQCNDCSFITKWKQNIQRHIEQRHKKTSAAGNATDEELFNKVYFEQKSDVDSCEDYIEAFELEEDKVSEILPSLWIALPSEEA